MAKNSKELRKALSLSAFYKLSKRIAKDYEASSAIIARSALMERYNVTEKAFYTMLDFSVTHHLVSDKIVEGMREKALYNQAAHGNKGYASKAKYDRLEEERKNYSAFIKNDIAYIITFYANHPEYTKEQIASFFGFYSTNVLDQLFKKACIELIITDKIFKKIRERAISNTKDAEIEEVFFEMLEQERQKAKKLLKR